MWTVILAVDITAYAFEGVSISDAKIMGGEFLNKSCNMTELTPAHFQGSQQHSQQTHAKWMEPHWTATCHMLWEPRWTV